MRELEDKLEAIIAETEWQCVRKVTRIWYQKLTAYDWWSKGYRDWDEHQKIMQQAKIDYWTYLNYMACLRRKFRII